jgi:hypothetical protein
MGLRQEGQSRVEPLQGEQYMRELTQEEHTLLVGKEMTTSTHCSNNRYLFSEPEFLDIYWRLKSQLFEKTRLFKGQGVQQGSFWQQFLGADCKDYFVSTVKEENK